MPFQRPVRPVKIRSRASRSALASGSIPTLPQLADRQPAGWSSQRMDDGVGGQREQEEGGQADQKPAKRDDAHGVDEAWRSAGNMASATTLPQ